MRGLVLLVVTIGLSQDEFTMPKSSIGGYGELHVTVKKSEKKTTKASTDFHRFVLFYGYNFNETWSFKSELELEHNLVHNGEGELELEQAYIDYHASSNFGFRVGVILAPVGIMNEVHEPPTFFGVERPTFSKQIIPTTWFDNGFSLYGILAKQFAYNFSIMGGLNGDELSSGIRKSRTKGYKGNMSGYNFNNPTFFLRADFIGMDGLLLGVSYMIANARREKGRGIKTTLFDFHLKYDKYNFHGKVQYGVVSLDKSIINYDSQIGMLFELGYDLLGKEEFLAPFFRYENISQRFASIQQIDEDKNNFSIFTIGLNYKPLSQIVFKLNFTNSKSKENNPETKRTIAFAAGYMF